MVIDTNVATMGSSTADFVLIPDVQDFVVTQKRPILPCYMYNSREENGDFYGRKDVLHRLEVALLPSLDCKKGSGGLRTFALCGMGGLGKTEVAVRFMLLHRKEFDAVFWLQADEPTKLREGFSSIATTLGLEDADEAKDQIASTDLAKAWLSKPFRDPNIGETQSSNVATWLLILDNADEPH